MLGSLVHNRAVQPYRHQLFHLGAASSCERRACTTQPSRRTRPVAAATAVNQEAPGLCCIPGLRQPDDLQHLIATTTDAVHRELHHVGASQGQQHLEGMQRAQQTVHSPVATVPSEALQNCEILLREWEPLVRLLQQHHPSTDWRQAASKAQQQLRQLQQEVARRCGSSRWPLAPWAML
jgi:hypothetical protein